MKKIITAVMAVLTCIAMVNIAYAADNGTEFGIEDDLWVGGTGGTWADSDVEIKGFSIFGSTTGTNFVQKITSPGEGNVIISSAIQVGFINGPYSYFVSSVTISGYGVFESTVQINTGSLKIGNGSAGQVLRSGGNGWVYWDNASSLGDNLGNHIATQQLNMNSWDINNVSTITFKSNVYISSASAAQYGGIYISTNVYASSHVYVGGDLYILDSTPRLFIGSNSGTNGQVLKVNASGNIYWGDDATGAGEPTGTAHYLPRFDDDGQGLKNSYIKQQEIGSSTHVIVATNITIQSSSATVQGKFEVGDTSLLKGAVTAQNGLSVTGGNASITNNLSVNGNATLGDGNGDTITLNAAATSGTKTIIMQTNGTNVAWIRKK